MILRIALKELRETLIWLKIIAKKNFCEADRIGSAITECEELIAIFVASTKTAEANKQPSPSQAPRTPPSQRTANEPPEGTSHFINHQS